MFASYPTQPLGPDTVLALRDGMSPDIALSRRKLGSTRLASAILPDDDLVEAIVLVFSSRDRATVTDLVHACAPRSELVVTRALIWLAKVGIVRVIR